MCAVCTWCARHPGLFGGKARNAPLLRRRVTRRPRNRSCRPHSAPPLAPGPSPPRALLGWVANGQWARSFRGAARSGTRGSRPPRPFVLFPLPRKRQRPRAAEERATPLELTAAAAVVLLHRQAFGLCFTLSFMLWERLVLL